MIETNRFQLLDLRKACTFQNHRCNRRSDKNKENVKNVKKRGKIKKTSVSD